MSDNQTEEGGLEKELMARFQDHLASSLESYCKRNGYTVADAARAMKVHRSKLSPYKNKTSIPPWESYFGLMIAMEEGRNPTEERVNTIVENLRDFFRQSILAYIRVKGISLKTFCSEAGFHESSGYNWVSEEESRHLPRAKDFFRVMAHIYTGKNAADAVMYPLEKWQKLELGEYGHLLKGLVAHAAGEDFEMPTSETENDLAMMVHKSSGFILGNPMGNALLMSATLRRLESLVIYFRQAGPKAREVLRGVCTPDKLRIRDATIEARHLVREEDDYCDYLKMNSIIADADIEEGGK